MPSHPVLQPVLCYCPGIPVSVIYFVRVGNINRYYGAMVPGLLAVADAVGFCILNSILGGQALSSIANISWACVVLRAT